MSNILANIKFKSRADQHWFFRSRLDLVLLFVAVFAVFIYLHFSQTIGDPDGFYHAKMALLLGQGHLLTALPWMQFATLKDAFTDHHFIYHLMLVPFVKITDPLIGVKLAGAFFSAGFFTCFYWLLKQFRAPAPLVYTILLITDIAFIFRLGLVKANSLALIVLLLIFYAIFKKRWLFLGILNFIYVWLYGGWLLSWVVAGVYLAVTVIYRRSKAGQANWFRRLFFPDHKPYGGLEAVLATISGSLLGLVLNPYWPQNLYFYWQQVWQIAIINQGRIVNVGGEWSSTPPVELVSFFTFIAIVYVVGLFLLAAQIKKISVRSWVFLTVSLIAIVFTIKSRRYIELSAPLSLLFAASAWTDVFPRQILKNLWHAWKPSDEYFKYLLSGVVIIGLAVFSLLPSVGLLAQVANARSQIAGGIPFERYRAVSDWLKSNTNPGAVVVHSDWDDWPMLFYYNTHNYYIIGLDPTFMHNYDPEIYQAWADLTAKGEAENLVELMTKGLKSQYAMIERDHAPMNNLFATNIYFRLVYEDDEVWVYKYVGDEG